MSFARHGFPLEKVTLQPKRFKPITYMAPPTLKSVLQPLRVSFTRRGVKLRQGRLGPSGGDVIRGDIEFVRNKSKANNFMTDSSSLAVEGVGRRLVNCVNNSCATVNVQLGLTKHGALKNIAKTYVKG